ncbi:MAG TPA: DUF433 domain-containing protein [Blastocatellia bacterium]|nr:DUF433 domain-containing protein [Blastocatellia bacterium]
MKPISTRKDFSLYGGEDPRELPSYSIRETAHYLRIPVATLRSWVMGRYYPTEQGQRRFAPIIALPDPKKPLLSFVNLVETHVLDAIRREHNVPLRKVRMAVRYLKRQFPSDHPLADQRLETDGSNLFISNLFIETLGQLINVSQEGQLAMRELLDAYLRRIERDPSGLAVRLYLFTRKRSPQEPKVVVIDPLISFGKPVLAGTGIPTAVIAERYKAGESMDELAGDYGRERSEIEEAIRCELEVEAA